MTTDTPQKPRSWKKRALSWGLAATALGFVAWVVPIRDTVSCALVGSCAATALSPEACAQAKCQPGLASTLSHARLDLILALVALYFVGTVLWAVRWRILLSLGGLRVTVAEAWRVTIQAQAGGILLPGGLGGDALRIAMVVGKGAPASIVVASVLLDRMMGLVTIASIAAAFGLTLGGSGGADPETARSVTILAVVLAGFPVGFVFGLLLLRSRRVRAMKWLDPSAAGFRGKLVRFIKPILDYVGDPKAPRAIVLGLCMSILVSAVQFACVRGLVLALGGEPSAEKWVYVGSAIAMIVSAVPALPGGWGTGDAAYVFFFGMAGLTAGIAFAVSLLYRLFWYLSAVVGAVLYFVSGARARGSKVGPEESPP